MNIIILVFFTSFIFNSFSENDSNIDKFYGKWNINWEKTTENLKANSHLLKDFNIDKYKRIYITYILTKNNYYYYALGNPILLYKGKKVLGSKIINENCIELSFFEQKPKRIIRFNEKYVRFFSHVKQKNPLYYYIWEKEDINSKNIYKEFTTVIFETNDNNPYLFNETFNGTWIYSYKESDILQKNKRIEKNIIFKSSDNISLNEYKRAFYIKDYSIKKESEGAFSIEIDENKIESNFALKMGIKVKLNYKVINKDKIIVTSLINDGYKGVFLRKKGDLK